MCTAVRFAFLTELPRLSQSSLGGRCWDLHFILKPHLCFNLKNSFKPLRLSFSDQNAVYSYRGVFLSSINLSVLQWPTMSLFVQYSSHIPLTATNSNSNFSVWISYLCQHNNKQVHPFSYFILKKKLYMKHTCIY